VLELGCGAGYPVTAAIAREHRVVGVDVSSVQLSKARENAPTAMLLQADMSTLELADASLDAVIAFYSITHVPRAEHGELIEKMARWLVPGGFFLGSLGAGDDEGTVEEDWLGAPMFFSSFDADTSKGLLTSAGFTLEEADVVSEEEHDGTTSSFLWVVARVIQGI
jgi:SAM-dependent methyltransferase